MELFTAAGKLNKFFFFWQLEVFDACPTGDTAHINKIFKFLPHTHINMGASIFLTAAMMRVFRQPCWCVYGKNLDIISMCAMSLVAHTLNISSSQKKNFFQLSCGCTIPIRFVPWFSCYKCLWSWRTLWNALYVSSFGILKEWQDGIKQVDVQHVTNSHIFVVVVRSVNHFIIRRWNRLHSLRHTWS
jgi:hypothetical protein